MVKTQKNRKSIDFILAETKVCYHKLAEFYSTVELNDLLLDFGEFKQFVSAYLKANRIETPKGFLSHYFGFMTYQALSNLYAKNLEAIRNGFYEVKIPLPHVSGEQMLDEAKSLAREIASRSSAPVKKKR